MGYLLTHSVEYWASKTPDQPAFRMVGKELSYCELWRRAGQLARTLIEQGVGRGDRVGIYMNKCLEMPLAVYGIMRAGAVFVPLDPTAPAARLQHMIDHCGIKVLISHPPKARAIPAFLTDDTGLSCIIGIDDSAKNSVHTIPWAEVDNSSENCPPVALMEQDLAYIMFTSGSTGLPKGIMHTHYSGLSYARLAAQTYDLNNNDRLGNHSPLHFDMSTLEYFSAPLVGATTVLIPEAYTKLPASLSQLIEQEQLSIWYSVPYALIQLLLRGVLEQRQIQSLRWVLFGGELFPPKYLYALMQLWPQARFSNVYGPAEVNQCSFYHIPEAYEETSHPIPVGHIWGDAEGMIVDNQDRPVSAGESGELLVRAPTMMQGYWEQPELNAKAYYFRPVTSDISDRFYRTGDLFLENGDGLLEFLGRKDRQVKIRGYRIEIDEIEKVLSAHPQVEECAVYVLMDEDQNVKIQAAVIVVSHSQISEEDLLLYSAEYLTVYALPETISRQTEFPRTTSGKIDRKAIQMQALQQKPMNEMQI